MQRRDFLIGVCGLPLLGIILRPRLRCYCFITKEGIGKGSTLIAAHTQEEAIIRHQRVWKNKKIDGVWQCKEDSIIHKTSSLTIRERVSLASNDPKILGLMSYHTRVFEPYSI